MGDTAGGRLECRYSRGTLLFGVLGGGAFVVLGLVFLLTGPVGIVLGLLCIGFFGFVAVRSAQTLRGDDRQPMLVVDDTGLLDRRLRPEPIPWSRVRGVDLRAGPTLYTRWQRFIALEVDDPDQLLPDRPTTRLAMRFNEAYGFDPITVSAANLDHGATEIVAAIRSHLPAGD